MNKDIEKDLQSSIGDHVHSGIKTLISSIPGVGGGAAELFNLVLSAPIEKRRDDWLVHIYNTMLELQCKVNNIDFNKLSNNELFITTIMNASQLAIRNHQKEKLLALHNAVINTALNINIDENEQMMFLNLIDIFTPWHLKLIYYLDDPNERFNEKSMQKPNIMSGGITDGLYAYYPDLCNKNEFVSIIFRDLHKNGIGTTENIGGTMTPQGIYASRLTEYGKRFLKYINVSELI